MGWVRCGLQGPIGPQGPKGDKGKREILDRRVYLAFKGNLAQGDKATRVIGGYWPQGPPEWGVWSLRWSGLFLGFLISSERSTYYLFNPDIPAFLYLSTSQNPPIVESPLTSPIPVFDQPCWYDRFAFATDDCTGQIYAQTKRLLSDVDWVVDCRTLFTTLITANITFGHFPPVLRQSDLQSIYCGWLNCTNITTCGESAINTAFAFFR